MSLSVKEMRERAMAEITCKTSDDECLSVDYLIDTEARKVLNLPSRPKGALPYIGWMTQPDEKTIKPNKTSQIGVNLIKKWEGLRTNAYLCPADVWTIGYGHTKGVKQGQMISHLEAENLLIEDLGIYEQAVLRLVDVPLNQNQFDALVSFTFNIGIGAFSESTLLKLLNQKDYQRAFNEFSRWTRAGGKLLPGLVNRRKDECNLFIKQ